MSDDPAPRAHRRTDPSVRDLEADIAQTRDRLAGSVDQLAAKLDVKTQASEKIEATKAQAGEKAARAQAAGGRDLASLLDPVPSRVPARAGLARGHPGGSADPADRAPSAQLTSRPKGHE